MRPVTSFRLPALLLAAGAAMLASACTYVERTPAAQPQTIVMPAQQPVMVQPAPAPTVTIRPNY